MTPARIMIIVVALVASVGLALFVHGIFARPKAPAPTVVAAAPPAPPMRRVLVAKVDLNVGDRLSADNMTWQDWPAATSMSPAYITDGVVNAAAPNAAAQAVRQATRTVSDMTSGGGPKLLALVGAIVRDPVYAGEPITSKKIVRSGDTSYMAVRLPPGMVAMSLPITVESDAGGFVNPGDRVDVLSTHADTTKGGGGMVTETVLGNTLVLAIDQHTDQPKAGAAILGATVTIEVPAVNAATVARARTQGGLTLALRSYADIGGHTQGGVDDGHSVRIFRGGSSAETVSAP